MIKAKVSTDYKDIERIFAGGSIQKEIIKVWSTEADSYVFEAWRILEMEGPLPLTLKANGEPLIDYRIYGNTVQNGTPTPENPIMPIGCGERTENLFDKKNPSMNYKGYINNLTNKVVASIGNSLSIIVPVKPNSNYTISKLATTRFRVGLFANYPVVDSIATALYGDRDGSGLDYGSTLSFSTSTNTTYIMAFIRNYNDTVTENEEAQSVMVNEGSTAFPYEPYGYKLPILSNSAVTNIYLGEVETTRRIKKLVLTGEENFSISNNCFVLWLNSKNYPFPKQEVIYCTHYKGRTPTYRDSLNNGQCMITINQNQCAIKDSSYATATDFKSYLASQYAAGTPVTVWYVLAEPETGIVNEPLMKIDDYADTIDSTQANVQIPTSKGTTTIDYDGEDRFITSDGYELVDKNQNGFLLSGSTLRPSKMYIKYKGR